jgi:hypothetical protein
MSEQGSICYVIQDGQQLYLCVINQDFDGFHRFPVTVKQLARVASEASWTVNGALGGYNPPLTPKTDVAQTVVR